MQLPRTLFLSTKSGFLAEKFPNDLYYFLGSSQDRPQSRCSTCFSDRLHSPNHRQSKSVTFLPRCPVVVAHVSVLPWKKYKVNGNPQNGSEFFFKILLFVAQAILQDCLYQRKELATTASFTQTYLYASSLGAHYKQRKHVMYQGISRIRFRQKTLQVTNPVWLCTWPFPQSTWASFSVSNPFSRTNSTLAQMAIRLLCFT